MDSAITNFIMNNWHGADWLNHVFKFITRLGDAGFIWVTLILVLVCIPKTRKVGLILTFALALEVLMTNIILKPIVARPRPYADNEGIVSFLKSIGLTAPSDASFPSGHAGSSFAVAVALIMLVGIKGLPAILLASLIAFSRVFLCVHYLTDVLAGALIGSLVAIIVVVCYKHLLHKKRD